MKLAPGFRFHPTDVELVKYYLKRKVMGQRIHVDAIAEVDIYKFAPSELPDQSRLRSRDLKWYFFCPREKKYGSGARLNRATECGYWKTTGKDRPVLHNNEIVGMIKTLIFHFGKAPRGERTNWVMHEYRLEDKNLSQMNIVQDTYVLCVVFKKDGIGPRNGAQYGAPFRENDWSDDDEDLDIFAAVPFVDCPMEDAEPTKQPALPIKQLASVATSSHPIPDNPRTRLISPSCVSNATPSADEILPVIDANTDISIPLEVPHDPIDDISLLLDWFVDDEGLLPSHHNENEIHSDVSHTACIEEGSLCSDENNIFNGLEDLIDLDNPVRAVGDFFGVQHLDQTVATENPFFLELYDLDFPLDFPFETGNLNFLQNHSNNPGPVCLPVDPSSLAADQNVTIDPSSRAADGHETTMTNQTRFQTAEPYSYFPIGINKRNF